MTRLALLLSLAIGLWASFVVVPAMAQPADRVSVGKTTGLAIPRFVSIRARKANLRVGPGSDYPVRWRLLRAGMPAQIVDEEGQWREVILHDGERGWLFGPLLSGARTLYVTLARAPIREAPDPRADIVALAAEAVVLRVQECRPEWCEVRKGDIEGWIARAMVWGVFEGEVFEQALSQSAVVRLRRPFLRGRSIENSKHQSKAQEREQR